MREIGFQLNNVKELNKNKLNKELKLKIMEYLASNGKEFFLEVSNKDNVLFGLLRLRFPSKEFSKKPFIKELKGCAIVRELHVYGQALNLGEKGNKDRASQHTGLGKSLMLKAEEIAKQNGYKKLAVISGIGVREYYKKLEYKKQGDYVVKKLS